MDWNRSRMKLSYFRPWDKPMRLVTEVGLDHGYKSLPEPLYWIVEEELDECQPED